MEELVLTQKMSKDFGTRTEMGSALVECSSAYDLDCCTELG